MHEDFWWFVGAVGVIAVIHGVVTVGVKWWIYEKIKEMQEENQLGHEENKVVLQIIRAWAESARTSGKNTEYTVGKVLEEQAALPSRADLACKLGQVPDQVAEKLAEKLVEKLHESGETPAVTATGPYPRPPSGGAPGHTR